MQHIVILSFLGVLLSAHHAAGQSTPTASPTADLTREPRRGDRMIEEYFRLETSKLADHSLADIQSLEDWHSRRQLYRQQLLEMLGLEPLPPRTDLQATVTGRTEHEQFFVENLHFQSRPGLYVTGNLYVPKERPEPLPAILYVCGHAQVKKNGVNYGSKVHYQHHGAWFARHGYVCLTIDTLQLGEIEGVHHGTYRENMWWWLNRGYTPAGVEAWNCVRALDYLQTREEVDPERLGVTGRSGGGAYSWWIAAIDDRIKCAVPVAGITDLQNHVVAGLPGRYADGCVEGHCDCMYMLNTHRWDYPQVAALLAPRPLMISNTDSDGIFPLDGVYRLFEDVRHIYRLYDAPENVALNIAAGGHADTQELRVNAFHWFNRHLKGVDPPVEDTGEKYFEAEQLRVFHELPSDQQNSEIHETFVRLAEPTVPISESQWQSDRDAWKTALREKCFAAWPTSAEPLDVQEAFAKEANGISLRAVDFTSQEGIRLRVYVAQRAGLGEPELVVLNVLDDVGWEEFLATLRPGFEAELEPEAGTLPAADGAAYDETRAMFASFPWAMAYVAPRGFGPTAWDPSEFKQTQHRRRFYLLGQTLDGMRVWDVRRAMQTLRSVDRTRNVPLWLQGSGKMAGLALYASLFEPEVTRLDLYELAQTHRNGPYFLNVQRYLDMPQAVAMAAEKSQVVIYQPGENGWAYPTAVAKLIGREKNLQLRKLPEG